jgi:FkbM family methyltransferase
MAVYAFCNDGDVVFDVGANIGSVSIPSAKKFNVYAFEPFKITHDILVKNIRENNVQDNITVYNVAVGDKRGKVSMDTTVKEMDGTEVKLDFESKEEINYGGLMLGIDGQKVDMITLDSLMDKVSNVKLIKVDVEGAEPLVFYGARELIKRDMPIIIFEKNWQVLGKDVLDKMEVSEQVSNFDIIQFCKSIGYERLLYLHLEDIVLIPPNTKRTLTDKLFQYWPVDYIRYLQKQKIDASGYKLYTLLKVKWDRTYDKITDIKLPPDKIIKDINNYSHGVFSQNGEDGIIQSIFKAIGTTDKYFVEFGTQDGSECNTRYLREKNGWHGLMMDGGFKNSFIGLQKEFITLGNILHLFKKYKVPDTFDLLSIDIDGNDFYIWNKICTKYKPRVIIVEYNSSYGLEDKTIVYKEKFYFKRNLYFGASITTFFKLARKYEYSLIGTDSINAYFIKDSVLKDCKYKFKNINNVRKLYKNNKNLLKVFKPVSDKQYNTYDIAVKKL